MAVTENKLYYYYYLLLLLHSMTAYLSLRWWHVNTLSNIPST